MLKTRFTIVALTLLLLAAASARARDDDYPKRAPWDGVRWTGDTPEVRHEGTWYGLVSVAGQSAGEVVSFCKRTYDRRWRKRFEEDLVEVLTKMGKAPGTSADLVLRPLGDGEPIEFPGVAMTEANRRAVWKAPERIQRDQALEDLDELARLLEDRYSYLTLKGIDHRAALEAIRSGLGTEIERDAFALRIQELLCRFGDGHTRVRGLRTRLLAGPGLNLRLTPHGEDVLLFGDGRDLSSGPHRVISLDGVPVARWLEEAGRLVADGSPQFKRRQAVRLLGRVAYLRSQLGLEASPVVRVEVESPVDGKRSEVPVPLRDGSPFGDGRREVVEVRRLGSVGYIAIREMTSDAGEIGRILEAVKEFRTLKGLVLDVRGNGGGSRDTLRALFPCFLKSGEPPHVANVAAYRLPPDEEPGRAEGYLENRHLYPISSSRWSTRQRKLLERFSKRFTPDWQPPAGQFSTWHYLVLDGSDSPEAPRFAKPVVILMDSGCFSATDVFLGAFKGRRGVTLLGTASGGGSGRSRRHRLSNSGIEIRLSSMASFRPNGSRYDGKGVEPDVVVTPEPADLAPDGDSDAQLDAALERLRK